jgi:glycerate kinase
LVIPAFGKYTLSGLESRTSRPSNSKVSLLMSQEYEPPVLVAPDSFKGTFRATEVAAAIGRGLEAAGLRPDLCPVADGGEGTLEALLTALGGETAGAAAHDPLGRPLTGGFALIEDGGTALVETAEASGLGRVAEAERDAWAASTYGTGELIAAAARTAAVVLVGVGGSATTDGGAGALEAIADAGGLGGAQLVVLCDVRTPWERCAEVFAPQKGADDELVARLAERLDALATTLPRDPRGVPMTGAAGGLAGGLWAVHGAVLEAGAPWVLDALDFNDRMRAARFVVTGEGRLDEQTLQGKVVGEIGTRTRQAGVPLHAVVGANALDRFGLRIIDLQMVEEATTLDEIEAAALRIGEQVLSDSGSPPV